jgi:hypothetical protein
LGGALKYFYRRERSVQSDADYLQEEEGELLPQGFNVKLAYGWGFASFVGSTIMNAYVAALVAFLRTPISVGFIKWVHEPQKKAAKTTSKPKGKISKSPKKPKKDRPTPKKAQ